MTRWARHSVLEHEILGVSPVFGISRWSWYPITSVGPLDGQGGFPGALQWLPMLNSAWGMNPSIRPPSMSPEAARTPWGPPWFLSAESCRAAHNCQARGPVARRGHSVLHRDAMAPGKVPNSCERPVLLHDDDHMLDLMDRIGRRGPEGRRARVTAAEEERKETRLRGAAQEMG